MKKLIPIIIFIVALTFSGLQFSLDQDNHSIINLSTNNAIANMNCVNCVGDTIECQRVINENEVHIFYGLRGLCDVEVE